MCRWIAYSGQPIYIEQLVTMPTHSLVEQSLNSQMNFNTDGSLLNVNADGFGIGWYAEREEPGVFKDKNPAWNDKNLLEICRQVRARIFMAHVRASTTGGVQRSNCHPFKYKNFLFQHNGHVNKFEKIRRDLQMDIAPALYPEIKGNTDSETFFLLALTYGLEEQPKEALKKMVERVQKACNDNKIKINLNLSCAMSNGQTIHTLRFADGEKAKTQFYSTHSGWIHETGEDCPDNLAQNIEENIVVVSEPLDRLDKSWSEIPENSFTTIKNNKIEVENFI